MLNFSRFLVVLTLFAVQSLAKPSVNEDFADYEEFDEWPRNIGVPGTPTPEPSLSPECKIDLLIIWDNSDSIGPSPFDKQVKGFFKNLINSKDLNVGPEGTHLGIITFSSQARTRVLLGFGNITTKDGLLKYIKSLTWPEVAGGETRTGKAFMLANEMFAKANPLNGGKKREDIKDVVMIVTDGDPQRARGDKTYGYLDKYAKKPYEIASHRRKEGETAMATAYAKSLRDKGIRVVGVYIGSNGDPTLLEKWTTTPSDAIRTNKAEFDKVFFTMVDKSCNETDCKQDPTHPDCVNPALQCNCSDTEGADTYLEHGKDTVKLIWEKPEIRCGPNNKINNAVKEVVTPEGTESPKYFEAGSHTITYKFTYQNGTKQLATLECPVKLKVENCSCPSRDLDVQYAKPGEKAYVEWKVPEASCTGGTVDLVEKTGRTTSGYYGVGSHTILYDYGLLKNKQKTVAKCSVKFEVKVCSCPSKDLGVFYMSPESDMGCMLPRPKPNCPGLDYSRTSPSIGGAGEKEPYAIGKHTVTYIYSMSNGLQVKCHVKLEMKVECGGEEYDPDKKQCCYGKLHDNQNPLWMCCGTAYYNPKLHKCCDLRNAHIVSTSGGECPNECAAFWH